MGYGYATTTATAKGEDRTIAWDKMDELTRPAAKRNMMEHEYESFENEWTSYKQATNISGQFLINGLWNTMGPYLKQLAFHQGDMDDLNTEDLMLARIKCLAVMV